QARRLETKRTKLDGTRNALSARSDDILSKREILLAYEQQDKSVNTLDELTESYAEIGRELSVSEQKYAGLVQLLSDSGRILILLLALALALIFGQSAVGNIGDAFFLISIYVRIFVPASNLLMRYDTMKRSEATSKTFLDVLESAERKTLNANSGAEWLENRDIKFSEVSFRYRPEDQRDVLHRCTFTVPAGKTTLLLGPSGSGKTTIARLLLKFWPLSSGSIQVGGREINEYSATQLRAHMSYVSQGDHIVEDTVGDNLSWGLSRNGITPERMREIIKRVAIDTPHGYDDILKVPAKELSIGQQQRLSIARMMLDESEIVIMDEPLAGVDVFTIHDLLPHLIRVLRERNDTVIMISHRLAFAGCADHVVILNNLGQVVEEGAPTDLIHRNRVFTSLHKASVAELSLRPHPEH
ncbi:MAG TPA: ABC transporter ATP-binding protein, partial [Pyrinomonadaceae bacterium]|nr:ABC transporter ATP-binding protein [Pyrinomonadaceae bacterium]